MVTAALRSVFSQEDAVGLVARWDDLSGSLAERFPRAAELMAQARETASWICTSRVTSVIHPCSPSDQGNRASGFTLREGTRPTGVGAQACATKYQKV